jgi:hypothetical protein
LAITPGEPRFENEVHRPRLAVEVAAGVADAREGLVGPVEVGAEDLEAALRIAPDLLDGGLRMGDCGLQIGRVEAAKSLP